ncbi:relaxin receptor 1-like [Lytechinus variegatus]|uniref:relaxin receptor 1-like n=1 Tax=Lytechinus variegatus TaxID=7654 RepID=UPI001BB2480E|nr:relaxin receptor 1-like [Lytechinus variegatus]
MRVLIFLYILVLLGRTGHSRCSNLCECKQRRTLVDVTCTDLDDMPQDVPCNTVLLNMKSNSITALKKESFSCLKSLVELLLSNNRIRLIEKGVFEDATQLQYIELDSNFLQRIPYLGTLPALLKLSVTRNSLQEWQQQTLRDPSGTRLSSLKLAFNKLQNLPKIPFRVLSLDLEGNAIRDISTTIFAYPKVISNLCISYNNIEYLEKAQTMENLKVLSLEYNYIKSISETIFNRFPSIKRIYLQGNKIVDVSSFCNMQRLEFISLEDNQIRFVGRPAFTNISKIETVILNANKINQISKDIFFIAPYSLDLSSNNILTLDALVCIITAFEQKKVHFIASSSEE